MLYIEMIISPHIPLSLRSCRALESFKTKGQMNASVITPAPSPKMESENICQCLDIENVHAYTSALIHLTLQFLKCAVIKEI